MKLKNITEVTNNPKAIMNDLRDLADLLKRSDTQKEIEAFIKGRNPQQNKIVASFVADLADELSGGTK
jgi:hypothetical protein